MSIFNIKVTNSKDVIVSFTERRTSGFNLVGYSRLKFFQALNKIQSAFNYLKLLL